MQNRLAMHAIRTGPRGAPITVFIHPVGLDLTYWGDQIAACCMNRDVIAYDLPGHGFSPGQPEDWTFAAACATLAGVMQAADADTAHIVGISIGSMIGQAFALAYPEKVSSLVLIGAAATFDDAVRQDMRRRAAAARDGGMAAVLQTTIARWFTPAMMIARPDIVDRVTKTMLAVDPLIYGAMWDMIAGLDTAPELHEIDCPTLIMTGEDDPICSPQVAQQMQRQIKGSSMTIVPRAAHMCILEQPSFINARLTEFFSECDGLLIARTADPLSIALRDLVLSKRVPSRF